MSLYKQLFVKKTIESLHEEMKGENRLRRVLGPVQLTALGVGAVIGAGIFVMTGRAAAQDAGPAIMLSYAVAGLGCAFAAFCYAEFAALAPVAGSAYTYAYATLGELMAWIIGWDLILEYAMSCACVAASWSKYFNQFLLDVFNFQIPHWLLLDPYNHNLEYGSYFAMNLPAVVIMIIVTAILIIGIRESATANAILTAIKVGVVLFVIGLGLAYVNRDNWTEIPITDRRTPIQTKVLPKLVAEEVDHEIQQGLLPKANEAERIARLNRMAGAAYRLESLPGELQTLEQNGKITPQQRPELLARAQQRYEPQLPQTPEDKAVVEKLLVKLRQEAPKRIAEGWGILGYLGLNERLAAIDDATRSNFMPFGISGLMLGAAIVFFAFIGFDSISAHSEEAKVPQRDVPIGIIASLAICTLLYLLVSAVITGMVPHPEIDTQAAIASAFSEMAKKEQNVLLKYSAALISTGALAGMTSVLLITFLSQARVFLAMARDRLLPPSIFGAIHPKFRTPHVSTFWTGLVICIIAAVTPIEALEEMVNIGTLFAFIVVCGAVLVLRITRPDAHRPFRAPFLYVIAPLGIGVNLLMALFLPIDTWIRLVAWLGIGLVIYFAYGARHSVLGRRLRGEQAERAL
jgi:amino acid transporter